ncbi:hypothetical protein [Halobacillus ihumii]|uniref:hypothetical protein n=1 Tax=Halobacillus ihumii TaxID=2686092 RepID=UPI0013D6C806|nr:hypothetical protein [Halobacillus ihumii]
MGAFIAQQPNGLYCRFSTVVDCPTHWNMTKEDYLNNITGTVSKREVGEEVLEVWLRPFPEVIERFLPNNMTQREFDNWIKEVSFEKRRGF